MFFTSVSKTKNKGKHKQLKLIKTYKLLHNKETISKAKRQPMDWEKIFANDVTDKGLISKIYKQLIQLNNNNKQTSQLKNEQKI